MGIDYYNNSNTTRQYNSTSIYMPLCTEHSTCCIFGTTTAVTVVVVVVVVVFKLI